MAARRFSRLFIAMLIFLFVLAGCSAGGSTDPSSQENTSAYIQNKGSDTIVNLALAWAELYQEDHPEVRISVTGGGSGTGIASLINGTVDIANASRQIKEEEVAQAREQGIEPVEHVIARDAIAVIVNPQNPVSQLTLQQISMIFRGRYTNWTELGGEDRPIVRVSRARQIPERMFTSSNRSSAWENLIAMTFSPRTLCCCLLLKGLSPR